MNKHELLNGHCPIPAATWKFLSVTKSEREALECLMDDIYRAFLREESVSTAHWLKLIPEEVLTKFILILSKAKWIRSSFYGRYHSLYMEPSRIMKYLTVEELVSLRQRKYTSRYRLSCVDPNPKLLVKVTSMTPNGAIESYEDTSANRPGLLKMCGTRFMLDTSMIQRYRKELYAQVINEIPEGHKSLPFVKAIFPVIESYNNPEEKFTFGNLTLDQRLRAICGIQSAMPNPIAHKLMRSCIRIDPDPISQGSLPYIWRYVAELCGFSCDTWDEKAIRGEEAFRNKTIPLGIKLHNRILLERIYHADPQAWDVPIEMDATASGIQMLSLIMNDVDLLRLCNVINTDGIIRSPWIIKGLSKDHVKYTIIPMIYGSGETPENLWKHKKLSYTKRQLDLIERAIYMGHFNNLRFWNQFIKRNARMDKEMDIVIGNDKFRIHCNRFKSSIETESFLYDSEADTFRCAVERHPANEDLDRFRIFAISMLAHNLDSQINDRVCLALDKPLSIFDAWFVHPNQCQVVADTYLQCIKSIYANRRTIRQGYLNSIGITKAWEEKFPEEPLEHFSSMCLK